MDQDRQVQSHQDLRPARLNCNLTEGIKIAKERICQSKEDYLLAIEPQTK